jgi:bacteriocin-like protein
MLMKYKDFKTMSQNEMKEIKGGNAPAEGGGACILTYTNSSGQQSFYGFGGGSGSCSSQSSNANSACVGILSNANASGDSCHYDCACDGYGQ